VQRSILRRIALPPTILGGVVGRSIRDNAERHVGAHTIMTMDIADWFQSISHRRVSAALREEGFSTEIANLGAPTSTMLANLCLLPLHDDLLRLADERDLRLTFWVDDITFSGRGAERVIVPAVEVVRAHGLKVRERKTRVMWPGDPHVVTGVAVHRKVSAGRIRIEEIRERIMDLSASPRPAQVELDRVWGSIAHVTSLCVHQGAVLAAFARRRLPSKGGPGGRSPRLPKRACPGRREHCDF